jgi:hypothetical protein
MIEKMENKEIVCDMEKLDTGNNVIAPCDIPNKKTKTKRKRKSTAERTAARIAEEQKRATDPGYKKVVKIKIPIAEYLEIMETTRDFYSFIYDAIHEKMSREKLNQRGEEMKKVMKVTMPIETYLEMMNLTKAANFFIVEAIHEKMSREKLNQIGEKMKFEKWVDFFDSGMQ